jgi:hypothetical protein
MLQHVSVGHHHLTCCNICHWVIIIWHVATCVSVSLSSDMLQHVSVGHHHHLTCCNICQWVIIIWHVATCVRGSSSSPVTHRTHRYIEHVFILCVLRKLCLSVFYSLICEWPKNIGHKCRQWLYCVIRITDYVVTDMVFIHLQLQLLCQILFFLLAVKGIFCFRTLSCFSTRAPNTQHLLNPQSVTQNLTTSAHSLWFYSGHTLVFKKVRLALLSLRCNVQQQVLTERSVR